MGTRGEPTAVEGIRAPREGNRQRPGVNRRGSEGNRRVPIANRSVFEDNRRAWIDNRRREVAFPAPPEGIRRRDIDNRRGAEGNRRPPIAFRSGGKAFAGDEVKGTGRRPVPLRVGIVVSFQ